MTEAKTKISCHEYFDELLI